MCICQSLRTHSRSETRTKNNTNAARSSWKPFRTTSARVAAFSTVSSCSRSSWHVRPCLCSPTTMSLCGNWSIFKCFSLHFRANAVQYMRLVFDRSGDESRFRGQTAVLFPENRNISLNDSDRVESMQFFSTRKRSFYIYTGRKLKL